ncbi:phosphotransferase [Glutamicibacter mishrai]|uniref:phosphotransferase n=1 Tax=Glutamicibacter mishrai TaxID=1775880 RepID=UPI0020CE12EC|nr:phosphotransferase [Glutamicibacter mishrai]UTT40650.1 phosphotransferase [Glutamicibacter mishrai]
MSYPVAISASTAATRRANRRGANDIFLAGEGVEFLFFIAATEKRREGYRVPRARVFNTANNPKIPARDLQHKELKLSAWAVDHGAPSARPEQLVVQDGYPVLITEIIDDDGTPLDQHAVGAVPAQMHQQEPPINEASQHANIYRYLGQRISHRYSRLSAQHQMPSLPQETALIALLEKSLRRVSLLHMDIRRQNIRVAEGAPKALIDWSNALTAAPEAELARIQEYSAIPENGLDYTDIVEGYRRESGVVDESTEAWRILRLDAALMLAGVFTSVSPREELAQLFLGRTCELLREL